MPPPEWVVEQWPGSATIIAVRSHGIRDGKPTDETPTTSNVVRPVGPIHQGAQP